MSRLHPGQRHRLGFAGAVVVAAACVGLTVSAPSAAAETIGGQQLDAQHKVVQPLPGASPLPPVKAATWVIADAETGEVLAHKGAHVQRAPASTLKMLTALTVLPRVAPDAEYVATAKAAYTYGSRVGLRVGKTYSMDELWYAVFLPSANDAAIAVAEANGGVRKTVRQMNALAYELRALDTVARNTSGLDAPGQLSSAYDLALIARAGLQREDFAHYASTVRAEFPAVKGKRTRPIYTTNRMLLHDWKGAIGVKTGYTTKAGRTFVGAATRGGRTLIVSLMGITEPTEEAAKKLLKWGFRNADEVEPVGLLVEPGSPLPEPGAAAATESGAGTPPAGSSESTGPADPGSSASGDGQPTAAAPMGDQSSLPVTLVLAAVAVGGATAWVLLLRRRSAPGRRRPT
jgi:D-alanyl-D-alanine carboxypeptidase (penicillin-binding protein 5/6)